jgi:transposase
MNFAPCPLTANCNSWLNTSPVNSARVSIGSQKQGVSRTLIVCDLSKTPKIEACFYIETALSAWPFRGKYGTTRSVISKTGICMPSKNSSDHNRQQGLVLSPEEQSYLEELMCSRTRPAHHIERASILLSCADGRRVREIANSLNLHRSKIYRCLNRACAVGIVKSLDDLPRTGRPSVITPAATLWILSLACQLPKELGYSYERWTTDLLAQHSRTHCVEAGHDCLNEIAQGTVVKILNKFEIKPHKVKYYLEARDPDFDNKMVEVLKVYKLAEVALKKDLALQTKQGKAVSDNQAASAKKPPGNKRKQKGDKLLARLSEHIEAQKSKAAALAAVNDSTNEDEASITEQPHSNPESALAVQETKQHANTLGKSDETLTNLVRQAQTVDELLKIAAERSSDETLPITILSYDEKPGIQAIKNKAPDLPPVPGLYPTQGRDYEYVRCGTVSLLAGTDLLSGIVHALVKQRHRSREFVEYLKMLDGKYPDDMKIVILLDNHSAHRSKETQKYLETLPNRFLFVFTPVHASWLNIIESFFSKMARSALRGMRVSSLADLAQRLLLYIKEVNQNPVLFRWRYGLELIAA